MDLKDFVAATLVQISEGVKTARTKQGDCIAPSIHFTPKDTDRVYALANNEGIAFLVEFDVAITAVDQSEHGAGYGIQVLSMFGAKGEKKLTNESSSVSRIRFDVPISYE